MKATSELMAHQRNGAASNASRERQAHRRYGFAPGAHVVLVCGQVAARTAAHTAHRQARDGMRAAASE